MKFDSAGFARLYVKPEEKNDKEINAKTNGISNGHSNEHEKKATNGGKAENEANVNGDAKKESQPYNIFSRLTGTPLLKTLKSI